MVMMNRFYCLLKTDGDQQSDANRSDVNEKVALGICVVRRMDIEHGR